VLAISRRACRRAQPQADAVANPPALVPASQRSHGAPAVPAVAVAEAADVAAGSAQRLLFAFADLALRSHLSSSPPPFLSFAAS